MLPRLNTTTFLCTVGLTFAWANAVLAQSEPAPVRIGTFDSRAVALAFWRSDEGMKQTGAIHAKYQEAKAANDEKLMKQLEIEGKGLQVRMHQQVFSTGSVTDIMARLETRLPAIAKEANVQLIVSKWQVAFQDPSVESIDVTSELVKQFAPSNDVLKIIDDLSKKEPVPIEELSMDPSH